jgi:hypothetical protein
MSALGDLPMKTALAAGAVVLCLLPAGVTANAATTVPRRCGAPVLSPAEKAEVEAAAQARLFALDVTAARAPGTVSIPVWFHVVNQGSGLANGDVPASMIDEQVAVMNRSTDGTTGGTNTPFRFWLAGVTRRTDAALFAGCEDASRRTALHSVRRGGAETLNIYVCKPATLFGWAYYPWSYASSPSTDGMVIHYGTLPGSTWVPFNRGDTAVHEGGHWLGLYHTFEGGCTTPNDQVSDTPAEKEAHYGCPSGLDSCPTMAGLDPVSNFMSYFDDDCIFEFTSGQTARMDSQHALYRGGSVTPTPTATPRARPTPRPTPIGGFVEITPAASGVTASTSDTNVPANTVDNNLGTRWSANGDGAWIRFDLGSARAITRVRVAVYNGNSRRNRFDLQVSADGAAWTTAWSGESSGTTTQEESYDFTASARYVRYVGHGSSIGTFNSVTEVSVFTSSGNATPTATPTQTASPTPRATATLTPTSTATPRPTPPTSWTEITPPASGATASTNDGNVPGNAMDNSLATRWSGSGDGAWLQLDLGSVRDVTRVSVAAYRGNERRNRFDVQYSTDGGTWITALAGAQTSGTTLAEESFDFPRIQARYLRYVGHGATLNAGGTSTWNSVVELSAWVALPAP